MRLSGPVDACPYRRVGPAPEGWELANQAALEEDIRFGLMVLWPAFKVGPWEARDATAATVKRATAKKRSGGLKRIPLDLKAVRRAQDRDGQHAEQDAEERRRAERWAAAVLESQKPGPMRRALELLMEGASRDQAADEAGVSRMTLYRHLKKLPAPK